MTPAEIRLKLIELARPQVSSPDTTLWIKNAAALEAWVMASTPETPDATEGQAPSPPQKRGPAKSRKPGEPEFGPALNV